MHAVFEREEVPAEQATSRPVDPVETKPAAAKGKKGKGRARKEPVEEDRKEPVEELGLPKEELTVPEEGTVSRKRSLSDLLGDAGEPLDTEPEPTTRLRPRGGR